MAGVGHGTKFKKQFNVSQNTNTANPTERGGFGRTEVLCVERAENFGVTIRSGVKNGVVVRVEGDYWLPNDRFDHVRGFAPLTTRVDRRQTPPPRAE